MVIGWLAASAAASTWWVPDAARADALTGALGTAWPGCGCDVRIGAPTTEPESLRWDGLELVWVSAGDVRSAPVADAVEAVLLARTWTLVTEPLGPETFLPDVPLPAPPPPPVVPPPPAVRRAWYLSAGVGGRVSPAPTSGLRVVAGIGTGPWLADLVFEGAIAPEDQVVRQYPISSGSVPTVSTAGTASGEATFWFPRYDRFVGGIVGGWRFGRAVGARVVAGPELHGSTMYRIRNGEYRRELQTDVVFGGVGGIGPDLRFAWFELALLGTGRVEMNAGEVELGLTFDVRTRLPLRR